MMFLGSSGILLGPRDRGQPFYLPLSKAIFIMNYKFGSTTDNAVCMVHPLKHFRIKFIR